MQQESFSLLQMLSVIYRWRKQLAYFVLLSTSLTILVSFLLSEYYTSTSTIAPANDEKELFGSTNSKNNSLYGDEDAIDRALIFAESGMLVDYMVETFALAERYNIDSSTPKGQEKVRKAFRKLYKVKKSELNGIELSIQDTDPEFAAEMLRELIKKLGDLYREATQPNKLQLSKTYEDALLAKQAELQSITDTLSSLRKAYGIYNVEKQGEMLSSSLINAESQLAADIAQFEIYKQVGKRDSVNILNARIEGNKRRLQSLRGELGDSLGINIKSYNKGADLVLYYEKLLETINKNIDEISTKYIQFRAQSNSQASNIIVLEPVDLPRVKSYPIRSLFAIGSFALSLILGILAVLLIDNYKHIVWTDIFRDEDSQARPE